MLIAALIIVGLLFAFITFLCWGESKMVRAWTWFLLLGLLIFLLVQGWERWLSN